MLGSQSRGARQSQPSGTGGIQVLAAQQQSRTALPSPSSTPMKGCDDSSRSRWREMERGSNQQLLISHISPRFPAYVCLPPTRASVKKPLATAPSVPPQDGSNLTQAGNGLGRIRMSRINPVPCIVFFQSFFSQNRCGLPVEPAINPDPAYFLGGQMLMYIFMVEIFCFFFQWTIWYMH